MTSTEAQASHMQSQPITDAASTSSSANYAVELALVRLNKGTYKEHWLLHLNPPQVLDIDSSPMISLWDGQEIPASWAVVIDGTPEYIMTAPTLTPNLDDESQLIDVPRFSLSTPYTSRLRPWTSSKEESKTSAHQDWTEFGLARFSGEEEYIGFLNDIREKREEWRLTKPPLEENCMDWIERALRVMQRRGWIEQSVCDRFEEIMRREYEDVKKNTWDRVEKGDGWLDGIKRVHKHDLQA